MSQKFLIPKILLVMLTLLMLTGCWDDINLENRAFVVSIGIDKVDDGYRVTLGIPDPAAFSVGNTDEMKYTKYGVGETILSAKKSLERTLSKKLDYTHVKICVINEDILKDRELFLETVDALERNRDLSKRIFMLATQEEAHDVLSATPAEQDIVGMFIASFYENNADGVVLKRTLQEVIQPMRTSGDVLIPRIKLCENKERVLELGGAAVISNSKMAGWLTEEELRGYFWLNGKGRGGTLMAKYEDTKVPFHIDKNKSKLSVEFENNKIVFIHDINIEGSVEEYHFKALSEDDLIKLEELYSKEVTKDIETTWNKFHKHDADGFALLEELRKRHYPVYSAQEVRLEDIKLEPRVVVTITNTGTIR